MCLGGFILVPLFPADGLGLEPLLVKGLPLVAEFCATGDLPGYYKCPTFKLNSRAPGMGFVHIFNILLTLCPEVVLCVLLLIT